MNTYSPPLYPGLHLNPAFSLRYSWCGFPRRGDNLPSSLPNTLLNQLTSQWESDGLRLLEQQWSNELVQLTFSTKPHVSPKLLAQRVKGRLQHIFRNAGSSVQFARHFSVRAIGNNTHSTVEHYIRKQVSRGDLADPRYQRSLESSTWIDSTVDLSEPIATSSGRYWYNLHLVLVTRDRFRIAARTTAQSLSGVCRAVARKKNYRLSALAVMPDHIHFALQADPTKGPEEIVLEFQNNTAWNVGKTRIWEDNYYAGTMGEYTMWAVRK